MTQESSTVEPQEAVPKTADPTPPVEAKGNGESTAPVSTPKPKPAVKAKTAAKPKAKAKPKVKAKAKPKAKKKAKIEDGVRKVLLSQIVVREGQNPRREFDPKAQDELVNSIRLLGLMHPVGLAPREEDDQYDLIWGERRFRAMKTLRAKEVLAVVRTGQTREEHYVMRVAENYHRSDLNSVDEAVAFQNYLTATGKTAKDSAEAFGVSPAYMSQRLKILKMAPELQLALNKNDINFTQARELARLDPTEQVRTLNQVAKASGSRAVDITRSIEQQRGEKRKEKAKAKAKADGKKRGRPARTKENAPDIVRQTLENAIESLNNFAIEAKPKTQVRDGLVTLYERFVNSRSDSKKEQLRGAVRAMEWALGIREEF